MTHILSLGFHCVLGAVLLLANKGIGIIIYVKPGNKNQMLGTHIGFEINTVNNMFFVDTH